MRAGVLVIVVGVLFAAACGGHSNNTSATSTTPLHATTSTSAFDPGATVPTTAPSPVDASQSPPLLAVSGDSNNRVLAPVWYFANAGATPAAFDILTQRAQQSTVISADGRSAAVVRPQTAVDPAGITIVDVKTGKETDQFDVADPAIRIVQWSPDGHAVFVQGTANAYLHKVSGATATASLDQTTGFSSSGSDIAFSTSGSSVSVVGTNGRLVANDASGHFIALPNTRVIAQLSYNGKPSALYATSNTQNLLADRDFRAVAGQPDKQLQLGVQAGSGSHVACGRFLMWSTNDSARRFKVYDVADDSVIDVGTADGNQLQCPRLSPDGTKLAFAFSDGVYVVDRATARRVQAAREGVPISWSADSSSLLVEGNGVFVVRADGSGGKKANLPTAATSGRVGCAIGSTGNALMATASGLVIMNVGANSARTLSSVGNLQLDTTCATSADGNWLLNGRVLVDIRHGSALALDYQQTNFGSYINAFRWYGGETDTDTVSV